MVVDDDSPFLVNFNSCSIKSELVSMWLSTSCDQDVISFKDLLLSSFHRLNCYLSVCSMILPPNNLMGSQYLNTLLGEDLVKSFSELLIQRGNNFIKIFDDGDIGTKSLIDRCHF